MVWVVFLKPAMPENTVFGSAHAQQTPQTAQTARVLLDLLEHFAHLLVLLEQLVHVFHAGAAAGGDAALALG